MLKTLQSRLFIATVCMLLFAAAEVILGRKIGLSVISADGINMLGHSVLLFIALAVDALRRVFDKQAKTLEALGGLAGALFLIGMALMMTLGAGHHSHSPAQHAQLMSQMGAADFCGISPGYWVSIIAVVSFLLHAGLSLFLLKDAHNLNVAGACLHFGITALMTGLIFVSGFIMELLGWWYLSDFLMYLITLLMLFSGARLGYKSHKLLNESL